MTVIIDKDYYEKLRTIKFKCNISYSNIIKHCIIKSLIRNDEQVLIEDSKMKKATTVLVYLNSEMDEAIRNLRWKHKIEMSKIIRFCIKQTLDNLECEYLQIEMIPSDYCFYNESDI